MGLCPVGWILINLGPARTVLGFAALVPQGLINGQSVDPEVSQKPTCAEFCNYIKAVWATEPSAAGFRRPV